MIREILLMFMIYSIIGWFWETPFVSIRQKKWINRGFLHGPMIPIYGFASVTIMISMVFIEEYLPQNKWFMIIGAIIYIAIIASLWEYITSYILEKLFHTRWWDYSHHKFNINGRIALDYSIGWGIGGYILWRFVNSFILSFINQLSEGRIYIILAIVYTAFLIDSYATIRELISLRQIMNKLHMISDELSDQVVYKIENLNIEIELRKKQFKKALDEAKDELLDLYDGKREDVKESFKTRKSALSENLLSIKQRSGISLSTQQRKLIDAFNRLLERSKSVSRFYKNYPKATSTKFKNILHVVRYKTDNEK